MKTMLLPSTRQSTAEISPPAIPTETAGTSGTANGSPTVDTSTPPTTNASSPSTAAASGEYVPATADGPAQNAPKPDMSVTMKDENKEGAEAAVQYFWESVD